MRPALSSTYLRAAATRLVLLAVPVLLAVLTGCGTSGTQSGTETGYTVPASPKERAQQVAWTSARASRCGFIFSPEQLRASYLAYERAYGHRQATMDEIVKAYDYTRESVLKGANSDLAYCSKDRVDEIRPALNRYLAGDYGSYGR